MAVMPVSVAYRPLLIATVWGWIGISAAMAFQDLPANAALQPLRLSCSIDFDDVDSSPFLFDADIKDDVAVVPLPAADRGNLYITFAAGTEPESSSDLSQRHPRQLRSMNAFAVIKSWLSDSSTNVTPLIRSRRDEHSCSDSEWAVIVVVILACILGVVGFVGGTRRVYGILQRRRKENTPHSFENIVRQVTVDSSAERVIPQEIKRTQIQLHEKLGSGQFGEVHKATFTDIYGDSMHVAVKVVHRNPKNEERTEEAINDLIGEAAVTAQFQHRNLINLVGVITTGNPVMLILQLAERGSLEGVLRITQSAWRHNDKIRNTNEAKPQYEIPYQLLLQYCIGIVSGMDYLASKQFVHRDLATRNVLLDAFDNPLVADFGLTRDCERESYYEAVDASRKLPLRWLAPECLVHQGQQFSEASDIWAFGVTVIEIFTGATKPYYGWTNAYVLEQVREGYRLPQPDRCPDDVYNEVILPCFSEFPKDRPTFHQLKEIFGILLIVNPVDFSKNPTVQGLTESKQGLGIVQPAQMKSATSTTLRKPPQRANKRPGPIHLTNQTSLSPVDEEDYLVPTPNASQTFELKLDVEPKDTETCSGAPKPPERSAYPESPNRFENELETELPGATAAPPVLGSIDVPQMTINMDDHEDYLAPAPPPVDIIGGTLDHLPAPALTSSSSALNELFDEPGLQEYQNNVGNKIPVLRQISETSQISIISVQIHESSYF